MKTFSISFLLFCFAATLSGQVHDIKCPKGDCGRFSTFINTAQNAADKSNFNQAIIQYNAARVCCPAAAGAIDTAILDIFAKIESQRKMADENAKRAIKAENDAKIALDKAKTLIGYFGFAEDRAWAYKDGKFAVIDRNARQLTGFIYEDPLPFQPNGYALARKGSSYLLVDKEGRPSREYDYLFPTNNGWYKVKKEGKYSFVDFKGDSIPGVHWYEVIDTFCNGMAVVLQEVPKEASKYGYINSKGLQAIQPKFTYATTFNGDLAWASTERQKSGLINKNGEFVVPPIYASGNFVNKEVSYARKSSRWGIVDTKGKFLVPPEYDERIRNVKDSIAIVLREGKWSYLNINTGKPLFPTQFDRYISDFSEGLATIRVDSLYKYIKTDGSFAFPQGFWEARNFNEGLAGVKKAKGDKWGFIDKTGEFVIEPTFDGCDNFKNGVVWVTVNKKRRLIDKTGKFISEEVDEVFYQYDTIPIDMVRLDKKWGFMNHKGEMVISPQFTEVNGFYNGYALVAKGKNWGYVAEDGRIAIEPQFTATSGGFFNGLAAVQKDNKLWGYIDVNGLWVIQPQYKNIHSFKSIVTWVRKNEEDNWELIDKKGLPIKLEHKLKRVTNFSDGMAAVAENNDYNARKWGYVDSTGRLVIPFQFKSASSFSDGVAKVKTDSVEGFIDKKGNFIIEQPLEKTNLGGGYYDSDYDYDDTYGSGTSQLFYDGLAPFKKEGKWGYIDKTGAWIIPPQFDNYTQFFKGMARVSVGAENNLINKTGEPIAKAEFSEIRPCTGKIAKIRDKNYRWGYINLETGKVIKSEFRGEPGTFIDTVAWVRVSLFDSVYQYDREFQGLINENGQFVIKPQYSETRDFKDGVAWARTDDGWGLINIKGDTLLPFEMSEIGEFSEDMCWIEDDGLRGYVDKTGKIAIPLRYEYPDYYDEEGNYVTLYNDYAERYDGYQQRYSRNPSYDPYYYEDYGGSRGNLQFLTESQNWGNFSGGLASTLENGKWGYINKLGAFDIEPQYEWAGDFSEGLAWVKKSGKWGAINKDNQFAITPKYEWGMKFSDGLAQIVLAGKFGVINTKGEEIVKAEYDAIAEFSEGIAAVKKGDKWGYINQKGELIAATQFDVASNFKNGTARISKFKEEFYINKKGQIIVDEVFEVLPTTPAVSDDSSPKPDDK